MNVGIQLLIHTTYLFIVLFDKLVIGVSVFELGEIPVAHLKEEIDGEDCEWWECAYYNISLLQTAFLSVETQQ